MQTIYKFILFIPFILIFTACSPKSLTVKTLHPSKIPNEKIYSVKVADFINDDLYQSLKIESKLSNKIINGKKVFKVLNTSNNTDAIIKGFVDSSLDYYTFYKSEIDYSRCRTYRYDKKNKHRRCVEYHLRTIPCVHRQYNVQTNIKVFKTATSEIIFAKTYNKTRNINECYEHHYRPYHPIFNDKREINRKLASLIADDFLNDFSPHYVYFDITIIEELDEENLIFTDNQKDRFEKITELMEKGDLDLSFEELKKLDNEFNHKSYEVIYNIGLIYEARANLYEANKLYKQAKTLVKDIDDLEFINNAIIRTDINLEEKIKAKSQLP
ncbi:hypothetical protein [Poseidonibacter antarcticus]|uniref:hypothetical protein n=1 Tax=Poseidonibacter antarcticus TaxID=2478538 RepID=UPI000EF48C45|nr:hypothetical protein [Poseidonibacter antarcticus]